MKVDALSGGRLEVGIGASSGFAKRDFDALGIPFGSWERRFADYAAAVEQLLELTGSDSPVPTTSPWDRRGRRGRGAVPTEQVADTLVLLVLALRSGLALEEALRRVADGSTGAVRSELQAVVAALRWGVPPARSWGYAGEPIVRHQVRMEATANSAVSWLTPTLTHASFFCRS